jgi:uncharacterized protein YecE (DUF72 family)
MSESPRTSPSLGYFLGCPVFASADWGGLVYPTKAPRASWLSWYSRSFNTVEGNSSFYSLPTREVIERWSNETAEGFQFCLKVPRDISHDARLVNCERLTDELIDRLRLLKERNRLGPSFLQLAPNFSAREFGALLKFVAAWPKDLSLSVEVRHADYFDEGRHEQKLDELLTLHGVDRCLFDSRCLYSAPASTQSELVSQGRKPNSPFRTTVTGKRPMLRFVGRDQVELADPWIAQWAPNVASWIESGLTPYIFTHAPNDAFGPVFARRFHEALRNVRPSTPELLVPDFTPPEKPSRQRRLF